MKKKEPHDSRNPDHRDHGMVDRERGSAGSGDQQESETVTTEGPAAAHGATAWVGKKIGAYHIKRVIASGGMGTVYEATQDNPRRTVAVKVMKHGIASRSALRRFEFESQLLARLRHVGIAQIYEAGTHDDGCERVPYFAMEYIPNAMPITDYAKEKKLGTRERLEMFSQVCDAVHHGHQKGIIHRDLKPSNILVDSQGQPRIIDFGVARSTDSDLAVTTLQTDVGQLIGTLQYMSPEQCEADPHDIDTRSDVYALGVLFYELLCERLPYNVKRMAIHQATRVIREQQPKKLSTVKRQLRGDVETIARSALEKNRERRYRSAAEFGDDIRRYLNNEAIIARPPSIAYHLRILARRNRAACVAIATILTTLFATAVVSSVLYVRADRERQRAVAAETNAVRAAAKADRVSAFLQNMLSTANPYQSGDRDLRVVNMLDCAAAQAAEQLSGEPEVEALVRRTIGDTYRSLALYEKGERELRRSVELAVTCHGENHEFVADTLHTLFWLLEKAGKYADAEKVCQRALAIRIRLHGEKDRAVAESLDALGDLYRYMGDLQKAEATLRRAREIFRSLPGETSHEHLNNFALVLRQKGEFAEAEALFREAIAMAQRKFGEDHPQTHLYWENLALMLTWDSRFAEAEEVYSRTCDAWKASLGATHPYTLNALHHHAETLARLGRLQEAETAANEAVDGYRNTHATENVEFAHALSILGMIQIKLDRPSDAEPALREALMVRRRVAPDSWRTSETMSLLGEALALGGSFAEAEPLLLRGYGGIPDGALVPYAKGEAIARIIVAYEARDAAEPGQGYDAAAAEWRAGVSENGPAAGRAH